MRHERARSGFTIVELAIVLSILAVIAGLALPRYAAAAGRYRVKGAAYRVVKDLELARLGARCRSASVGVSMTLGPSGGYQITGLPPALGPDPYIVDLSADPYGVSLTSASFGGSTLTKYQPSGTGVAGDITVESTTMKAAIHIPDQPGAATIVITGK